MRGIGLLILTLTISGLVLACNSQNPSGSTPVITTTPGDNLLATPHPTSTPASEVPVATGWLEPVNITSSPDAASVLPSVHVSLAGEVLLSWVERKPVQGEGITKVPSDHHRMYLMIWSEGRWSDPFEVPFAGGWLGIGHRAALAPDGTVHFLTPIEREGEFAFRVMAVRRSPAGEWSVPEVIFTNPSGGQTSVQDIVFDSQGTMHVSLFGAVAVGSQAWSVSHDAEGVWTEAERVSFNNSEVDQGVLNGTLAMGSDDTLYLTWADASRQAWMLTQRASGGEWQRPIEITPESYSGASIEGATVDQDDNLHFVWNYREPPLGVKANDSFYAVRPKGGVMSPSENISATPRMWETSQSPTFAVDGEAGFMSYGQNSSLIGNGARLSEALRLLHCAKSCPTSVEKARS